MKKLHVLIVDDTSKNIQLVASVLKPEGYGLYFATDAQEAFNVLKNELIDLILLDVMMPTMDGFKVCKELKKNVKTQEIPVIFLTAKNDKESIKEGFEVGGVDYIIKPFYDVELLSRVKTHLRIAQMTQELRRSAEKMYELANTDALTGIANRLRFNTITTYQIENSLRYGAALSMIFFDIDYFKKINDEFGHEFGDKVLRKIAQLIENEIRKSDVIARWGGEEFAIILANTRLNDAEKLAQKLRLCIENHHFEGESLTCSFGVTQLQKEDTNTSFMKRVDDALYEAKRVGRNCVIAK